MDWKELNFLQFHLELLSVKMLMRIKTDCAQDVALTAFPCDPVAVMVTFSRCNQELILSTFHLFPGASEERVSTAKTSVVINKHLSG